MLNQCYFCKGPVIQQRAPIDYRWGDTLVVIEDVPAGVCRQCGEKYLSAGIYKDLESIAENRTHRVSQMTVDVLAFDISPPP